MLQNLHVKNLALIEESEVEFSDGLNILSGETGAGKSIIIGSINLALGEKVQKEMLRENAEYALVELVFRVDKEHQVKQLEALDVYPEDGLVIISRKISNGRSIAKINAETVPTSKVKEVASILIDIHGQHEHQSLLSKKKHLEILDSYAKAELAPEKEKLETLYHEYRSIEAELKENVIDEEERLREVSFLEYEINEIVDADLHVGEDEQLENNYKRFLNGKKIMEALNGAYDATGGRMDSATELVGRALRELGSASGFDEKVGEFESQLAEIDNLLNDFNREISDYMEDTEFDDETFYAMEKRLDELNHLKAKYGRTLEEVLASLEEKQQKMEKLRDYDAYLQNLQQNFKKAEEALQKQCEKVSSIRKRYASELVKAIRAALEDLNFLDVAFEMQFGVTTDYTANGTDDAEFMISTNPGEPVKPLGKVASGGELSRIMLAIKTVLADSDEIETLIFDEIDSGISGRTAQMVSEKMNVLGKRHQIICITHLPQIAAMADSHYLIEKSVQNNTTISNIRWLSELESIGELARMIGGVEITETVRESAKEMKELAQQKKK